MIDPKSIITRVVHFYGHLRKFVAFIIKSSAKDKQIYADYQKNVLEGAYKLEHAALTADNIYSSKLLSHCMIFYKSIDNLNMLNRKALKISMESIYDSFTSNSDKDFMFLNIEEVTFINFWVALNDSERQIVAEFFDKMYWCAIKILLLDKDPQKMEDYLIERGVDIHAAYKMYETKMDGKKIIINSIISKSIANNKYVLDREGATKASVDIVETLAEHMKIHGITENDITKLLNVNSMDLTKNIDSNTLKNIFSGGNKMSGLPIDPKMKLLYESLQKDIIEKMKNKTYDRSQIIDMFISLLGEVCNDNKNMKENKELQYFLTEFLEQLEKNATTTNQQMVNDFKRIAKAIQGDAKIDMTEAEKEKAKKSVRKISRMLKNPKVYFSKTEKRYEKVKVYK